MILEITAHAGSGEGDYAWDYGSRRGTHARLNLLLEAIAVAADSHVPHQDEFADGYVRWELDGDRIDAGLRRRIVASPDIRIVTY